MTPGARAPQGPSSVDRRLLAGDPLRGIAALSVFLYHCGFGTGIVFATGVSNNDFGSTFGAASGVLAHLDFGVFLFFALSGYLLGRPFLQALVDREPLPSVPTYLWNRVLRIVPAFYVAFGLLLLSEGTFGADALDFAAVLGFAQVYHPSAVANLFGQAWTLDIEAVFYVALPLGALLAAALLRDTTRRRRAAVLGAALLLIAVASLVVRVVGPDNMSFLRQPHTVFYAFVPGLLVALADVTVLTRAREWKHGEAAALGLAVVAVVAFVVYVAIDPAHHAVYSVSASTAAGAMVAAPLVLQRSAGRVWRVLDNRPLHWIGERAYGVYLLQFLVIFNLATLIEAAGSPNRGFLVALFVGLPLTAILAALSFSLVERPFLRLKRRWTPGPRTASLQPEPAVATSASPAG